MTVTARKYNPGFLTDDELVASFCVRTDEFESMMEALREPRAESNAHQIVIGPRGSGKTSLLLRVAAEIRMDARLSSRFFPVVFAEESYEVSTAGEFWLEALSRLADQAPNGEDGPDLHRTFGELRQIRDDRMLGDRCLGALQDFADREAKRLVLMVENLNMLFRDTPDDDTGWRLRQTLQTEPRILLLASATTRFDEMDDRNKALFDLFRVRTLQRLNRDECAVLWRTVSGRQRPPETIQPLRILTGGSPRWLSIVARFGARLSFRELMADILDLVDDHTEYFKSHLDALPAQERRVYLALADLWVPATARQVADRARLDTSKCSAHLARLIERGVVEVTGGSPRRRLYYLAERLYNIYYLMRRARGPDPMIESFVRFMEGFYSTDELKEFGTSMAREASELDGETLSLYRTAFQQLVRLPSLEAHRHDLISLAPATFADLISDTSVMSAPISLAEQLVQKGLTLAEEGRFQEAVDAWDEVLHRFGASDAKGDLGQACLALLHKGMALDRLQRPHDALAAYEEALERFDVSEMGSFPQEVAIALCAKGVLLAGLNRLEEALAICDEVLERFGTADPAALPETLALSYLGKGLFCRMLNRPEDALAAWDDLSNRFVASESPPVRDIVADALFRKGETLALLHREEEGIEVWDELLQTFGSSDSTKVRERIAASLSRKIGALTQLNRLEEALVASEDIIWRFESNDHPKVRESVAASLVTRARALAELNRLEEALEATEEVIRRFGSIDTPNLRLTVLSAQLRKAAVLTELNRSEQALIACDEVMKHDNEIDASELPETIASLLVVRGTALLNLNRQDEALAVYGEVIEGFAESDSSTLRNAVEMAFFGKAIVQFASGWPQEAIRTLNGVLERESLGIPEIKWQAHMTRARAHLVEDDVSACERDVEAALVTLRTIDVLPKQALNGLTGITLDLGVQKMRDLIVASPSSALLLPLTTALEMELGLEPRVAKEVEEVAEDIRRDLQERRKAQHG